MSDHDWGDILDEPIPDDLSGLDTTRRPKLADGLVRWGDINNGMLDKLDAASQSAAGLPGLPTGFPELDEKLHGLQRGRLYLAAALTGAGKSVFLGDLFRTWMTLSIPSCMVTLEMDREEVWRRQAAAACRINHGRLQDGDLADEDWSRLARWVGETDEAPAWVCDKTTATIADLHELVMAGVAEHGWQAVIVDYAQKITARGVSREQAVAAIAVGLKTIAREANVPVIVGAQLNREATKRPGGVPKLADLRESAALEHETDVAILIHRPDYDDPKSPRAGEADLIVAKNRGGERGTVTVAAQLHWQRFVPFTNDELTTCVSCYRPHPGQQGTKCAECSRRPR